MAKHEPPKIMIIFRIILILAASFDIISRPHFPLAAKVGFVIGILLLHLNDYGRNVYQLARQNRILYYLSMITSIVGTGWYLIAFDNLPLNIYFVFPLVEIFLYRPRIEIGLLLFHIAVFLSVMFVLEAGVQSALFPYLALIALIYLFRSNSREKEKGNLLNAELIEANAKLKEITIVKERTRIAQELHDSLGHGLIALKMHLEFAANTIDADPAKSKDIIKKALGISQTSITDLRKAVDVLKDDQGWGNKLKLRDSLEGLIESLQTDGRLTFEFFFDDTVEYTSKSTQKVVYETVREAITNGIKHGKARTFHIDLFVHDHKLFVKVEDDGTGCAEVKKSHGLKGMEERIHSLNGKIDFVSAKDDGFAVEAELPFITRVE